MYKRGKYEFIDSSDAINKEARYNLSIGILGGIALFIFILLCSALSSCVSMRPAGYLVPVADQWIIVPVANRVEMRGYWKALPVVDGYDRMGYYLEYPNNSAGGGVYKWYDTGDVVWDYEPGILE